MWRFLNIPPVCSDASSQLMDMLWPPKHQFVPIEVLGVTDPEWRCITITIDSIFQDEPVGERGQRWQHESGWSRSLAPQ